MNELDRHMKHNLKVKHYLRYTDDFVIVSGNKEYLHDILPRVNKFLQDKLKLKLHPNKVSIRQLHQGVDFLGYVVFLKHQLVRSKTRRRIFKKMREKIGEYRLGKIAEKSLEQSLQSYLGVLSHANTYKLSERLKNEIWF